MSALSEVRDLLDTSLDPVAGSAEAALETLSALCDDGMIAPLVDDLIADTLTGSPEAAARAGLSYRHALGFDKSMLLAGPPAYMLRAHVWRPSPQPVKGSQHIHNHRFGFASTVLLGALRMRLYVPDPAGAPVAAFREEILPEDEGWQVLGAGSGTLRMSADLELSAGTRYCLDPDALHQVLPRYDLCTVTLFLETAALRTGTDIYAAPGTPDVTGTAKQPLPVADYRESLRDLRSLLP